MKIRRWLPFVFVGALAGCPGKDAAVSPEAGTGDAAADVAVAIVTPPDAGPEAGDGEIEMTWVEAIRVERWKIAEAGIAKLPDGEKNKPEMKYARAKVAIGLAKHADAITLLDKLEDDLPLMRDLVARARAAAQLEVGPYDKAADYYAAKTSPSAWLSAAQAWEKADDPFRTKIQCDRVVAADKKTRAQEEKARATRMRITRAKEGDTAAIADARWLASHALDDKIAEASTELLDKAARPLEGSEVLTRAKILAEAGRSDDALKAVERAAIAKSAPNAIELCRARAEAYYKSRSRYPEAALQYRACSAMGGAHAGEDAFLSARAFSRGDRDGDAVSAFGTVIQRYPKTTWADQAEFHIARTHALAGRWKEAARAFDDYAKLTTAHEKKEAERYRAIAHLMAQDHKVARKLLEELSGNSDEPLVASRWAVLAGLAALQDGDRTHAIARWTEVARSRPLTWPALVARARLTAVSAPLPLTIDPAEAGEAPPALEVELPPPSDLLHRVGLDGEAEEMLRERESQIVAKVAGRGTEALCNGYAMLDRAKRRYQVSLGVPASMLAAAPGPKNRWAWDCAFPRPHRAYVQEGEANAKLPRDLVWAVMRIESAFDPEVVSPARAVGLMQLLPETARTTAANKKMPFEDAMLTSPQVNIALGATYLRELLDKLGEDVPLAVGAYNGGPDAIQRWTARSKGVPLDVFVETIPFIETRGYVVRVMGNLARYGFLERGEAGVPHITLDLK